MNDKIRSEKSFLDLTEREAYEFIYDKPGIVLTTLERKDDSYHKNRLQKLRGGRPREDEIAAMADELRSQRKKWSEVKAIIEQTTHEYRSAGAYRKQVVAYRKRSGKNTPH